MNKGKLHNLFTFVAGSFAVLALGQAISAQTIDSTAALRLACETNPGNTVTIDYPAKISNGAGAELPEQVGTGCTVVIAPSGSFETDQVGMNFNGPFSIQAASQTQVKLVKSRVSATTLNLTATGAGSYVGVSESLLRSTAGDLNVITGFGGVFEVLLPLSGALNSLESEGALNISGGGKFEGSILETQISAASGINVSLGGAEGIFKTDKSNLATTNGAVTISSQGFKSLVEMSFGEVRAANGFNVTLPGSEGNLVVSNMVVNSGAGAILFDVARIGNVGKISVTGSRITSGGGVSILSSLFGRTGLASVEDTAITAGNAILVQTGRLGETIAKTNTMNSPASITFRTGLSGKCLAEQNVLVAPFVRACR